MLLKEIIVLVMFLFDLRLSYVKINFVVVGRFKCVSSLFIMIILILLLVFCIFFMFGFVVYLFFKVLFSLMMILVLVDFNWYRIGVMCLLFFIMIVILCVYLIFVFLFSICERFLNNRFVDVCKWLVLVVGIIFVSR